MLQNKVDYCAALLPSGSENNEDFAHSVICSYIQNGVWMELVVSDTQQIRSINSFSLDISTWWVILYIYTIHIDNPKSTLLPARILIQVMTKFQPQCAEYAFRRRWEKS